MDNPSVKININIKNEIQANTIFDSVNKAIEDVSNNLTPNVEDGLNELSELISEYQQDTLISNGNVRNGDLLSSITANVDGLSSTIGSTLDGYSPSVIEYGRSEVYPINASCLHYVDDGKEYFVKSVSAYKGNPYVQPSYEYGKEIAKETILNNLR